MTNSTKTLTERQLFNLATDYVINEQLKEAGIAIPFGSAPSGPPKPKPHKRARDNHPINNTDLWACIRGLNLWSSPACDLLALIDLHQSSTLFASKVITQSARMVLAQRVRRL